MSSSVINGAIGKSPLIDKMNQMAVEEVKNKAAAQMEIQICGGKAVKYPPVSVSFPKCKAEMKKQMMRRRKERQDGNGDF